MATSGGGRFGASVLFSIFELEVTYLLGFLAYLYVINLVRLGKCPIRKRVLGNHSKRHESIDISRPAVKLISKAPNLHRVAR